MHDSSEQNMGLIPDETWQQGSAPVAVVLISLNEAHNIEAVIQNLKGWAQEVFLVDSYSQDETVDIALQYGVHVVQRRFQGFGDQWNFALRELPITAPWTMKMDPDERLSDELKANLIEATQRDEADGFSVVRRLWFMGRPLPIRQKIVRVWRTGLCRFTEITVNEHPIVDGKVEHVANDMEHHDSPDLDHWLEKQNRYTTAEAIIAFNKAPLADTPRLMGSALQRTMWLKKNYYRLPFRYFILFIYYWLWRGTWRAGFVGYAWARLRPDVMRLIEYKRREMQITGRLPEKRFYGPSKPDSRVQQFE
ncbi:glycosyltransferase family 2 protein [Granulosicoccus sp.]|nr:glycosyltransferase family 2 protein [Granulosicoccus sp.]